MEKILKDLFDDYGIKTVTHTDKSKNAYVLTTEQVRVLDMAGKLPSSERPANPFDVNIIGNDGNTIKASYYHSERVTDTGRDPEPRMGQEFISRWLEEGDRLFLATDGEKLFACKLKASVGDDREEEAFIHKVIARLSDTAVRKRTEVAPKHPKERKVERREFIRDLYIVEAAKRRAGGSCEMPGCSYAPFFTPDGAPYFEVHHIQPLAEDGEDSLENVAVLCPKCHREQHYAIDKYEKRNNLLKAILDIVK